MIIRRLITKLLRLFFRTIYDVDLRYEGEIPSSCDSRAFLVVANHLSYYDPPLLAAFWPRPLEFLAGGFLFKRGMGALFHLLGARAVGQTSSMKWAIDLLKKGGDLVIFPEGTRSISGEILPFERGAAFIASKARVDIVPVYIQGLYEIWPAKASLPKWQGKITLLIGKTIRIEPFLEKGSLSKEGQQRLTSEMERAIKELSERIKR